VGGWAGVNKDLFKGLLNPVKSEVFFWWLLI
jgi:hypothetical protein